MSEIIAVMGGQKALSHAVCEKLVRLAQASHRSLRICIVAYRPSFSRFYLHEEAELNKAKQHYEQSIELLAESVGAEFKELAVAADVKILWQVDSFDALDAMDRSGEDVWFAMLDDQGVPRNIMRESVHRFSSPVFWLNPTAWSETISLAVGVDPMHEHDRPASTDNDLLITAKSLKRLLHSQLSLVHSCNFPAYVEQYREKIGILHRDSLDELAKQHHIPQSDVHLVQGNPDTALVSFVKKHHTSMLLLGSIARNPLHRSLIGSTTEELMRNPPCDLMFIKPRSAN